MSTHKRIYLDNAATSWPKPESVYLAVDRYQREIGAPAGRSAYHEATQADRLVNDVRRKTAELIGAQSPDRIVVTLNGTDSLNLAIHGVVNPGDHVVTSAAEHNSVLRPLRFLEDTQGVTVTRVPCDGQGFVDPRDVSQAIRPNTKLLALIHASNVTGAIQPVAEFGRIARDRGIVFLVDAAQTLGHESIAVNEIGADLLAAPGHKGLLGPLGTGVLYIAPGMEDRMTPLRQGGTGTQSSEDRQPDSMPDKFESGNHNVVGLAGLDAALDFIRETGVDQIRLRHQQRVRQLLDGLNSIDGLTIYGPKDPRQQVGVVSLTLRGSDPQELATMLDTAYSIQVRSGIHCAPRIHAALGTANQGGTVRLSVGVFTTRDEIDDTIAAILEVATVLTKI